MSYICTQPNLGSGVLHPWSLAGCVGPEGELGRNETEKGKMRVACEEGEGHGRRECWPEKKGNKLWVTG